MSLLIDALRKAEQDREQGNAPTGDLASLSLEPMTRAESGASQEDADTDAARRQAAANLFDVKDASVSHGRLTWFALAGVAAGVVLAAYVWWQMQPSGLALAPQPAQPAPNPLPRQAPDTQIAQAALDPQPPPEAEQVSPLPPERPAPAQAQRGSLGHQPVAAGRPAPPPRAKTPHLTRTTARAAQVPADLARAYAAYSAGHLAEASAAYRAHLAQDRNSSDALNGMGAIALQSGRPAAAAQWFRRALSANPDDPIAQAGLASAHPADQPIEDEIRLRALADRSPDSPAAAFALGNVLARQQRWAEAQEAYFAAHTGDPGNPDYLFNLAVSLDRLAQPALARDYYQRALDAAHKQPAVFDPAPARARLQALIEATR